MSIRRPAGLRPAYCLPVLLTISAALCFATALPAWGSTDVVALERFGKGGDSMPAVAESFVDEAFFSRDMTAAAASREYYTAVYTVPASVERPGRTVKEDDTPFATVERRPVQRPALGMWLSNPEDEIVDVTVSVRLAGEVRNHLVRVEPERSVGLDLTLWDGVESLVLIAFTPFEARVELTAEGVDVSESLDVLAPIVDRAAVSSERLVKGFDYSFCQAISSWLRITDSAGGYVIAYGNRFLPSFGSGTTYFHEIEYPAGTLFHRAASAASPSYPFCKSNVHGTERFDFTKAHTWYGLDDLVFRCIGPATAVCTRDCNNPVETFTVLLASSSLGRCF